MMTGLMTIPNLFFLLLIGWLTYDALVGLLALLDRLAAMRRQEPAARDLIRDLRQVQRLGLSLEGITARLPRLDGEAIHPAYATVRSILESPAALRVPMVPMAMAEASLRAAVYEPRARFERAPSMAPSIGLAGSVAGFLLAVIFYGLSPGQTEVLLQGAGTAVLSTLFTCVLRIVCLYMLRFQLEPVLGRLEKQTEEAMFLALDVRCQLERPRRGNPFEVSVMPDEASSGGTESRFSAATA